jgi:hypothetical protein
MNFIDQFTSTHDEPGSTDDYRDRTRGLRDMLGLRPQLAPRPEFESQLYDSAAQMRQESSLFQPLVKQRLRDISDPSDEIRMARGNANADTAQAMKGRGGSPFDRAMTRGKALSRVAMQGQNQAQQQSLRDRVGMSRFMQGLRAGSNRDLNNLGTLQGESTAASMRAKQDTNAAFANTLGSIAGAGYNWWSNRPPPSNTGSGTGAVGPWTQQAMEVGG